MALINLGNIADDGTGDDLRTAFSKINGAFTSLGITSPGGSGSGGGGSGSGGGGSGSGSTVTADVNGDIYVNKVFFKNSFANLAALPSAATYPGMFVYVAGDGAYFSNGTTWKKIPAWNNSTVVTDAVLRWNGTEFVTTDAGVKTFNNRSGSVTLTSVDITNAIGSGILTNAGGRIAIDAVGNITFGTGASLGVTGFIKMPAGTIAQRPVIPVLGMFRYNNETDSFEGYVGPSSGPSWRTVGPLGSSPATFTNLIATGTATVNSLDATAGIGINGAIGTVTPSTASVTTLTSSGLATFSNTVTLTSNTVAHALGTGALVVSGIGGASIGGNLYVGGLVNLGTSVAQSTSTTTGALVIGGGVGIGKNLNVGGDLDVTGIIKNNFIEYTSGVSSPTPATTKSYSIHGFNAYSSTDFPGNYYTGWTVKGGVVGAQLAVGWDVDELGSNIKIYARANDDTGSVNTWSSWERIVTTSNLPQSDWTQTTTTAPDFIKNKPTYTNNGVAYASSTTALSTGNALTFNGTDLTCTGNITAYSDARIKKNVTVIDNALSKVQALNGYTFERTDIDVGRQTGVIAQEVMNVLPEAVSVAQDGMYIVAYGNMVGLLIESIKELSAQVAELKLEIERLKLQT
jgi:hypothetical protein